jgi:hypothetical protein
MGMGEIFLLLLVAAWLLWRSVSDYTTAHSEQKRRDHKVALRRQHLNHAAESPSAYEALGDAMRHAGHLEEAIACYEEAKELAARLPSAAQGAGEVPGAGLDKKLHLTRFELREQVAPSYGNTMRTRQQICRQCGALSLPQETECTTCGCPLPVDSMFDTLRNSRMRNAIAWEAAECIAAIAIVFLALLIASWMDPLMRICLAVAAIFVIPFRLLKHFTRV